MGAFNYTLDEVMNMGFFEVYRLWTIYDEKSARDLQHFSVILDNPHSSEERRKEVWGWLTNRQPRRNHQTEVPRFVLDRFAEAFKNAQRK